MTLAMAIRCADGGVLLSADREESGQIAKRSIDKIFRIGVDQGTILVSGAGRGSILDNAFMRLETAFKAADSRGDVLFDTHCEVIRTVLRQVHEEFIWGHNDQAERAIRLIITASFKSPDSTPWLYGTDEDILYPNQLYGCVGSGQDLAYYFIDKLYSHHLSREAVTLLAAFIFREVSQSVSGVGLGTDMVYLAAKDQRRYTLPPNKIKELEVIIPDITEVIANSWNTGIAVPEWLKEFFT